MDREIRIARSRRAIIEQAARRWLGREPVRSGSDQRLISEGPAGADTKERGQLFEARERRRWEVEALFDYDPFSISKERIIGPTLDFSKYAPDEEARRAGRPVARIVEKPAPGRIPQAYATGFLVSPNLLLTNHHVFSSASEASGMAAQFLYEYDSGGLKEGVLFDLDPGAFFVSDEALDFALVAVQTAAGGGRLLSEFGFVRLIQATGKILVGHPINIIQHPEGRPKQYATTQNKLLDVLEAGFLHYSTDTLRGSSGSPAFNRYWELVALHHCGVPLMLDGKLVARNGKAWDPKQMSEDEIQWVANEGVRVSAIVNKLREMHLKKPEKGSYLRALLDSTADPLEAGSPTNPALPSSTGRGRPQTITINIAGNATIFTGQGSNPTAVVSGSGATRAASTAMDPAVAEKKIRFDKRYDDRTGYQEKFLTGFTIPVPDVKAKSDLLKANGKPLILGYHHFSLAMHKKRRLQMWSAVNVDYSPERKSNRDRKEFGSDTWIPDPRIPPQDQIEDDEFYKPATKIDRGHIVRRDDNAWGRSEIEIEYANSDTFHWTNCTPQHERFNREQSSGLWGQFEAHIKENIGAAGNRASIFAGPVLHKSDPRRDFGKGSIQYPLRFWKVIATVGTNEDKNDLSVYGFLFDQSDKVDKYGIEAMEFSSFRRYQVSLNEITRLAGVEFPKILRDKDVLRRSGQTQGRIRIESLTDIRLR